jgi:hypothetical protein
LRLNSDFHPIPSQRTAFARAATGFTMSKITKAIGSALQRPIIKLRATSRRNAILYAHMSPEQLRERKRMLDELHFAREQQSALLLRHRLPGSWF